MKIFIIFILAIQAFSTPIRITRLLSKFRQKYDLPSIKYNYEVENLLNEYRINKTEKWFYQDAIVPENYTNVPMMYKNKTLFKMNYPRFNSDHITEDHIFPKGWLKMCRDTFNGDIKKTFKFRIRQKGCFDWNLCSKNVYNYYSTCYKKEPPTVSRVRCSWANQFLPKFLERSFTEIACIKLDLPGPYLPDSLKGIQKRSFICYYKADVPNSDHPFMS
jgi:hypothetical protein